MAGGRENWVHYKLKDGEMIFMCKKCLTLSTRPRAAFDKNQVCNACLHAEAKRKTIDWDARMDEMRKLCDKYRRDDGHFDVLVPCSGGKDGSYVSWKMKHELGMHPLCITFNPQMQTEVGRKNLENFINSGFDHILISPNPKVYQKLGQIGFKEEGRPKMPFVTGALTAIFQAAINYNIPFIVYGEEGETEYGGVRTFEERPHMSRKEMIDIYFSGYEPDRHSGKLDLTKEDLSLWKFPSQEELDKANVSFVCWSYFEDWDPELHAKLAKEKCGLQTVEGSSVGTYTNYAQLDDKLQDLHAYTMYIKFGFGRAWSDACIDIRRGAITREQGIEYVKKHDGIFPKEYLQDYLEYFDMSEEEFWKTIDSFRSPDIWERVKGEWKLKFDVDEIARAK